MRENKVQKRATREREQSRKYLVIEIKITRSLKKKDSQESNGAVKFRRIVYYKAEKDIDDVQEKSLKVVMRRKIKLQQLKEVVDR